MSQEPQERDGEELARLMIRTNDTTLASALIGCEFYKDDPEALFRITQCDPSSGVLTVTDSGRPRKMSLSSGYVTCSGNLLDIAIKKALRPRDRLVIQARTTAATYGLQRFISEDDLLLFHELVTRQTAGEMPRESERRTILEIMQRHARSERQVLKVTSSWLESCEGHVPADVLIAHATLLRALGDLEAVVVQTNCLTARHSYSRSQEATLLTIRAASMADLFERHQLQVYLDRAFAGAKRAWGFTGGGNEHLKALFGRLRSLERQGISEEEATQRLRHEARLKQAEDEYCREL